MDSLWGPLSGVLVWRDHSACSTGCVLVSTGDLSDVVDDIEVIVYCLMTRVACRLWRGLDEDAWDACLLLVVVSLKNFRVGRQTCICGSGNQFRRLLNAESIVSLSLCCLRRSSVRIVASYRLDKLNCMNRGSSDLGFTCLISKRVEGPLLL